MSNERTTGGLVNHFPLWSVQGSNLRPPVNVSPATSGETPSSPTTNSSKSRLSPRKDGETAHPIGNQTAIQSPVRSFRVPQETQRKEDQGQLHKGKTEKSLPSVASQRQTPKTRILATRRGTGKGAGVALPDAGWVWLLASTPMPQ